MATRLAEQRHKRAGSAPRRKKRLSTEAEDALAQWLAQGIMTCRHRQRGCWRALLPAELDMISGIPGEQALESPTAVEPCASNQGEVAPSHVGDLRSVLASTRREDKEAAFQVKVDRLVAAAGGRALGGAHHSHDSDSD